MTQPMADSYNRRHHHRGHRHQRHHLKRPRCQEKRSDTDDNRCQPEEVSRPTATSAERRLLSFPCRRRRRRCRTGLGVKLFVCILTSLFSFLSTTMFIFVDHQDYYDIRETNDGESSPHNKFLLHRQQYNNSSSSHKISSSLPSSSSSSFYPPRILLGIFSKTWDSIERKRRHVIRNTYLNFDYVHNTTTPNRVCSLQQFQQKILSPKQGMKDPSSSSSSSSIDLLDDPYQCQLVYTFVLQQPNNNDDSIDENLLKIQQKKKKNDSKNKNKNSDNDDTKNVLESLLIKKFTNPKFFPLTTVNTTSSVVQTNINNEETNQFHERDVIYLNTIEDNDDKETFSVVQLAKVWTWFQFGTKETATAMSSFSFHPTKNGQEQNNNEHFQNSKNHDDGKNRILFDYIAHTETNVLLYPTEFWKNEILLLPCQKNRKSDNVGHTMTMNNCRDGTTSREDVYAGIPSIDYSHHQESNTTTMMVMSRFVLLSTKLFQHIASHSFQDFLDVSRMTTTKKPSSTSSEDINASNNPDEVVAILVDKYRKNSIQEKITNDTVWKKVSVMSLKGVDGETTRQYRSKGHLYPPLRTREERRKASRLYVGDYVQLWDAYKDSLIEYNNNNNKINNNDDYDEEGVVDDEIYLRYNKFPPIVNSSNSNKNNNLQGRVSSSSISSIFVNTGAPKMILGIFTMDSPDETKRRDFIRNSYLNFYKSNYKNGGNHNIDTTNIPFHPNKICSLQNLIGLKVSEETNEQKEEKGEEMTISSSAKSLWDECQIAYTFVMGAHPSTGPKELVDNVNRSNPITIQNPSPSILRHSHVYELNATMTDVIFLNIRENMKEGKSQTWLKYVTLVMDEHQLYFDYIGKIDGDTLLYPDMFIDTVLTNLPKYPTNQRMYIGDYRINPSKDRLNVGPSYMGGAFYIMSIDLGRWIVSTDCPRLDLAVYSEDQSIGNFINSHPKRTIHRIRIFELCYVHPLKGIEQMKSTWDKYLSKPRRKGDKGSINMKQKGGNGNANDDLTDGKVVAIDWDTVNIIHLQQQGTTVLYGNDSTV